MKATLTEHDGCFAIELEAETMQEAALITRAGMNSKKELRSADAYVEANGNFLLSAVLAKSRKANNSVPKRN